MKRNLTILLILMIAAVTVSSQVRPPLPRPSSKAAVMQTVGTTEISIVYARPEMKGRLVFADASERMKAMASGENTLDNVRDRRPDEPLVAFGHLWRAGANEATVITFADDVLVNGQPLAAGKYSLHMIPTKDDWTIIFNKELDWGSFTYKASQDALRVKTKTAQVAESKELLTFGFENVGEKSATAYLRWEKVKVPFTVEIKDVVASTMTRLKAYVAAAKADDPQAPLNAANYAKTNMRTAEATAWFAQALKINDDLIKVKETFQNQNRKATILLALGRMQESLAAAERTLVVGKADSTVTKAQIDAVEKRIADIKAGKQ